MDKQDEKIAKIRANQRILVPAVMGVVVTLAALIFLVSANIKAITSDDCICYDSASSSPHFRCADEADPIFEVPTIRCYYVELGFLGFFISSLIVLINYIKRRKKEKANE